MTDERITICEIVNGCADCPRMGDDCDGDPDRMGDDCDGEEEAEE